jgi:hypothetical protein
MRNNIGTINMKLNKSSNEYEYNDVLEQVLELLSVPEGYNLKSVQSQKQNEVNVAKKVFANRK